MINKKYNPHELVPLTHLKNIQSGNPESKPKPNFVAIKKANQWINKMPYELRVRKIVLHLSLIVNGAESAAYHICDYIELAIYCIGEMAKEFGNGILVGQRLTAENSLKIPSELLIEHGLEPQK